MSEEANQLCYIIRVYSNPNLNTTYEHVSGDHMLSFKEIEQVFVLEEKMRVYHSNCQSSWFKKRFNKKEKLVIYRNKDEVINREKTLNEMIKGVESCFEFFQDQ